MTDDGHSGDISGKRIKDKLLTSTLCGLMEEELQLSSFDWIMEVAIMEAVLKSSMCKTAMREGTFAIESTTDRQYSGLREI